MTTSNSTSTQVDTAPDHGTGHLAPQEFAGRTALVTGAASGIGLQVARRLAQAGAAVVVADHNEQGANDVARKLTDAGGRAAAVRVDVTDPESVRRAVDFGVETFGALHLAVNNAGIAGASAPTGEYAVEEWQRVIDTNLNGVFYSLRYELPRILAAGGGAVVNMSSILGTNGFAGSPAYAAAKHAVVGLTKTAAVEYAARGVRINAVAPGFIDTPLLQGDAAQREQLVALHPQGRLGTAEEVAELTLFLLSDRASFINGSYHLVDGGYAAR
ncbi:MULTISPECIES: SDR family NAD(P)-dependent oxidoreductase [Streptomyces]|uniref:SDR family NAD(P)-dependent oxidoreductase n=1 Tax=Streptomyces TaxID=1883 RepID=UPI001E32A5B5|nr:MULTISPECIES: SDR family NAD(P)-dependent oxidoreductase [Streptomyces]UFQ19671.1 SDR family oxidoreductase [Streptomyces huasconensis]WCL89290.1 SDR family NAD(P)-dependent oxidoreductase [Streptomyces sp. JCM 35825]